MRATLEALSKGTVQPVYVLGGNEWLLVSRCMNAVRTAVVGTGPRGLSEDIFDGDSATIHHILGACRTLPMMILAPRFSRSVCSRVWAITGRTS